MFIMYKFSCPYSLKGCSKQFRSQSGWTYHVRSAHGNNHNILHNQTDKGPQAENEVFHDNRDAHELPVGEDALLSAPASLAQAENAH